MDRDYRVRVVYPLNEPDRNERMVLRTDIDWDQDIEPVTPRDPPDHTHEFHIHSNAPYHYFKPMVVRADGTRYWSKGENYLITADGTGSRSLYPYFHAPERGFISQPLSQRSTIMSREVTVRVYTPPGYGENSLKRYPVLYMHDGRNLFFPEEAFLGQEWRVDETLNFLDAMNLVDKVLVVGIYAGDRMTEYTEPGYHDYGRFITDELIPMIAVNYRSLDGPKYTAVMGSSLGGVVSLYLAWQYPDYFSKAACLSSTFAWRDNLMDRIATEPRRAIAIYLDSGWPRDNYEVTRSMRDLLLERGYRFGTDLHYLAFPGAPHNEPAWATRFHIPFQLLFGKTPSFSHSP